MRQDSTTVRMRALAASRRMILAEDDDEVREVLASIFAADGFIVSSARNGHELVRMLEGARDSGRFPDIIVTDHRMPGFSGLEIVAALRDNAWPVPVIIITAFARDLDHAGEHGADVVFSKPFDADDLRTAVLYCIERRPSAYEPQNH